MTAKMPHALPGHFASIRSATQRALGLPLHAANLHVIY